MLFIVRADSLKLIQYSPNFIIIWFTTLCFIHSIITCYRIWGVIFFTATEDIRFQKTIIIIWSFFIFKLHHDCVCKGSTSTQNLNAVWLWSKIKTFYLFDSFIYSIIYVHIIYLFIHLFIFWIIYSSAAWHVQYMIVVWPKGSVQPSMQPYSHVCRSLCVVCLPDKATTYTHENQRPAVCIASCGMHVDMGSSRLYVGE